MRISGSSPGSVKNLGKEKTSMQRNRYRVLAVALAVALAGFASTLWAATELTGAAILEHPCGKASVRQMGLVHAGKMQEANQLTTAELQEQWTGMSEQDRTMMSGMMKEMSQTEAAYAAAIKANGVLAIDGGNAKLTVKKTTADKSGSSTETVTQNFKIDGNQCLISR
jgi:hypothetical protein